MQDTMMVQHACKDTRLKKIGFAPSLLIGKLRLSPTASTYPRLRLTIWAPKH